MPQQTHIVKFACFPELRLARSSGLLRLAPGFLGLLALGLGPLSTRIQLLAASHNGCFALLCVGVFVFGIQRQERFR